MDLTQTYHVEGLPFGTRGGMLIRHNFPVDGEYVISVSLSQSGLQAANIANGEQLEISLNGRAHQVVRSQRSTSEAEAGSSTAPSFQVRTAVKAGSAVDRRYVRCKELRTGRRHAPALPPKRHAGKCLDGRAARGNRRSQGPLRDDGRRRHSQPPPDICLLSRKRAEGTPCAKDIISKLSRRAFRRPVTDQDMEALMAFYQQGRDTGNFEEGIKAALQRILVSPEFIFRFEAEPAKPGEVFRISDVELASRLSFFLWSSAPDDELMNLAAQGKLKDLRFSKSKFAGC